MPVSSLGARVRAHARLARAERNTNPDRGSMGDAAIGTAIVAVIVVVILAIIFAIVYFANSYGSTDGGHVAIVRNGGPFDNTKIRQVLAPNSGRTNIGEFSTQHNYPTSQRFFTISGTGHGDSNDVVQVPTADGVEVGIEGTAYFTLNTSAANHYAVLKKFDNLYGTRSFRCTNSNDSKAVYDGDAGFSCFLDQVVSPVINNDLRNAIGDLRCADLVASCSLVQNNSAAAATATIDPKKVGQGNVNLGKIENDISSSLQTDMDQTLGGHYLIVEKFNLAKVDLPGSVQAAINSAQSAFAGVTRAQASLSQANIQAQTNAAKERGYRNCPACQQIDILGALPKGLTTLVLPPNTTGGGGVSISIPAK